MYSLFMQHSIIAFCEVQTVCFFFLVQF